ncbi:hypothetical protein, partial [[Ruminococcus] torques]|uniref:hypothetical protein n=1 Tax=[Ruminococcus] torques TaxID=33039 RepID=UPI003AB41662
LRNWQVTFLLYTLGVFISEYTAKAFTEPRDYRVVFLIQKKHRRLSVQQGTMLIAVPPYFRASYLLCALIV